MGELEAQIEELIAKGQEILDEKARIDEEQNKLELEKLKINELLNEEEKGMKELVL